MNEAQPAKLLTSSTPLPAGRSLHLVDVENLLGGTAFAEHDVAALACAYRRSAAIGPSDPVIVASSHHTAPAVWFGWGDARRLVRSGSDGADLALLDVIEHENVAARFQRIVIGSGDGIFAFPAAALQRAGVAVTVVSQPEFLSNRLRLAARDVRFLAPPVTPAIDMGVA
jgi:hypothetical protein